MIKNETRQWEAMPVHQQQILDQDGSIESTRDGLAHEVLDQVCWKDLITWPYCHHVISHPMHLTFGLSCVHGSNAFIDSTA